MIVNTIRFIFSTYAWAGLFAFIIFIGIIPTGVIWLVRLGEYKMLVMIPVLTIAGQFILIFAMIPVFFILGVVKKIPLRDFSKKAMAEKYAENPFIISAKYILMALLMSGLYWYAQENSLVLLPVVLYASVSLIFMLVKSRDSSNETTALSLVALAYSAVYVLVYFNLLSLVLPVYLSLIGIGLVLFLFDLHHKNT